MPDTNEGSEQFEVISPSLPQGVFFGASVGMLVGAAAGWACCWLVEANKFAWLGAIIAAVVGFCGGGLIGARQMRDPRKAASPDIATYICVLYALFPAGIVLLGGLGWVVGKFSGYLVLATAFGIPMVASLIGAVLDRAYEGTLREGGPGPS
jgi:hypothetical protein